MVELREGNPAKSGSYVAYDDVATKMPTAAKHAPLCPAPGSDYEEFCTCVRCEMCDEPAQDKRDVDGLAICDECWPHLVRECAEIADDQTQPII